MSKRSQIADTKSAVAYKHQVRAAARLGLFVVVLSLVFIKPLIGWVQLARASDTSSYIILIPFVVVYLARLKMRALAETSVIPQPNASGGGMGIDALGERKPRPCFAAAIICWVVSIVFLSGYWLALKRGWEPTPETQLAVVIGAYYGALLGGAFLFLGSYLMRELSFAAAFLAFMIPFPTALTTAIEIFFQYASAEVSYWFLTWSGTPVLRDGLRFKIPGITMRVAQECSGIRSSLVLFICSLIAGHMFLRTRWRKVFLTVFVIPLAIVRNGLRILTIGLLCVHIGPEMIHSVIHRRGGPFFFALSLIPFFLVLWWLVRSEKKTVDGGQESGGRGQ